MLKIWPIGQIQPTDPYHPAPIADCESLAGTLHAMALALYATCGTSTLSALQDKVIKCRAGANTHYTQHKGLVWVMHYMYWASQPIPAYRP